MTLPHLGRIRTMHPFPAVALAVLLAPLVAGCLAAQPEPPCDSHSLLIDATIFLSDTAHADGGVPARTDGTPDPRTTAWVLLATGLSRRAGTEGLFDAAPHVEWLKQHVDDMMQEGTPVDSIANNASLARLALQVWGKPAAGIAVTHNGHDTTLAAVWDDHYDSTTGRYGTRSNEHLFGAFAAWLFGANDTVRAAMAHHTESLADNRTLWGDTGPFAHDAWWAAYARIAIGPRPENESLDVHLAQVLRDHHSDEGGVRGFASADNADASTTAAAMVAWRVDGIPPTNPLMRDAVSYLCGMQRHDGAIPFSRDNTMPLVKTTAEVVIAAAMLEQPVPWGDPQRAA